MGIQIHCFITTTNHIARKFKLLLPIPHKGMYLRVLHIKQIHISFITDSTSCYLSAPKSIMGRLFCHMILMAAKITI